MGASHIIGIDTNEKRFDLAKELGCSDTFNPSKDEDFDSFLEQRGLKWGLDFTFDCTGDVYVMR